MNSGKTSEIDLLADHFLSDYLLIDGDEVVEVVGLSDIISSPQSKLNKLFRGKFLHQIKQCVKDSATQTSMFVKDAFVEGVKGEMLAHLEIKSVVEHGQVLVRFIRVENNDRSLEKKEDYFFDLSVDLVAILLPDGTFERINKSYEQVVGWSQEELIGRKIFDIIHLEDISDAIKALKHVLSGGVVENYEHRLKTKDDGFKWISLAAQKAPDGKIYTIAQNIDFARKSEEQLKSQERQFRSIFENASDIIALVDRKCQVIRMNRTWMREIEFDDQPVHWSEVFGIEKEELDQVFLDMLDRKRPSSFCSRIEYQGKAFYLSSTMSPVETDGRIERAVIVSRDITDEIERDRLIREKTLSLEAATSVAKMGVLTWNIRNNGLSLDPAAYRILNIRPERFNSTWEALIATLHPGDRKNTQKFIDLFLDKKSFQRVIEFRVLNDTGGWEFIRLRLAYLDYSDPAGRVICICQNISDQKNAEALIQEQDTTLELAIEVGKIGIWEWDVEMDKISWNEQAREIFGVSSTDQFMQEDFLKRVHKEDVVRVVRLMRKVMEDGSHFVLDYRVVRPDDSIRYIHSRGTLQSGIGEASGKMIGIILDVTEGRSSEQKVRRSEVRFRNLFNASSFSIWEKDISTLKELLNTVQGLEKERFQKLLWSNPQVLQELLDAVPIVDVNQETLAMYKASSKEEFKENVHQLLLPHSKNVVIASMTALFEGKDEFSSETRHLRMDGEFIDVFTKWKLTEGGTRLIQSCLDITGQKRLQRRAQESELIFRQLYDITSHAPVSQDGLQWVLEKATRFLAMRQGGLWEKGKDSVRLHAQYAVKSEFDSSAPFYLGASEIKRLVQVKDVEVINSLTKKSGKLYSFFKEEGHDTLLKVPIYTNGRIWGLLIFLTNSPEEIRYSENQILYVELLATWLGNMLEKLEASRILKESEEKYRLLTGASTSLTWVTDGEGRFRHRNKNWELFTGQSYHDYKGFGWSDVIHPDDKDSLLKAWEEAVSAKSLYHHSARLFNSATNRYHHFIVNAVPFLNKDGSIKEWFGANTDISNLKKVEEALENSKERFRHIYNNAEIAIFQLDSTGIHDILKKWNTKRLKALIREDGKRNRIVRVLLKRLMVIDVNQTAIRLMEADDHGQLETTVDKLLGKTWLKGIAEALIPLLEGDSYYDGEISAFTLNRKELQMIIRWRRDDQFPNRVLLSLIDVTQLKTAQDRIIRSEARFRDIFHSVALSIWELDTREMDALIGRYRAIGVRDFREFFQQYPEKMTELMRTIKVVDVNNETFKIYDADSYEELIENLQSNFFRKGIFPGGFWESTVAYAEQRKSFEIEAQHTTVNGRNIDVLMRWQRGNEASGKGALMINIIEISNVKNIQNQLKSSRQRLAEQNRKLKLYNEELEHFTYVSTHDLKVPIINIESYIGLLRNELGEGSRQIINDSITWIQRSVKQARATLDALVQVAKVRDNSGFVYEEIPLKEMVEGVMTMLQREIEKEKAQVKIEIDEKLMIGFSRVHLQSIIQNLVTNSLKYRHPDRHPGIMIRAERRAAYYRLSVTDNGLGIDLDRDEEKVFGLFKRAHDHVEGTGMGMYLSRKIMENNGGKMELESELGVGSTFHLYFKKNRK